MKRVVIVGAGGFGREVLAWATEHAAHGCDWQVAGFLDDNAEALRSFEISVPILGPISGHVPDSNALYLCALGSPEAKRRVCGTLVAAGARFLTLVHPRATVGPRTQLGDGVVVCPGAVVSCDVTLGAFVTVNLNATIGHDAHVGAFSTLSAHADVTGFVRLGDDVFLGSRAGVVPGKIVGDRVHIGAGSTVIADIPSDTRVFGIPARRV